MRTNVRCMVLFVNLLVCSSAFSYDGNALIQMASSHDRALAGKGAMPDGLESARLIGYVSGVVDELVFRGEICIPQGVTYPQIVEIVKKDLRAEPATWHLPGNVLVAVALTPTFPCSKEKAVHK